MDNFNETIVDDKFNGLSYIEHIIAQTNGADPAEAWLKFAKEEIFSEDDIKNGSFYRMIPGLIDVCYQSNYNNKKLLTFKINSFAVQFPLKIQFY